MKSTQGAGGGGGGCGARTSGKRPVKKVTGGGVGSSVSTAAKASNPITRIQPPPLPPPKRVVDGGVKRVNVKITNNDWNYDNWERFRESKLEKMRQHKLSVEQRMRERDTGDNYNYYWDNINHCYSNQRHAKKTPQKECRQSLHPSWYTDNIHSNWSVDLDDEDFYQRTKNVLRNKLSDLRLLSDYYSCDINGNSPYHRVLEHNGGGGDDDDDCDADDGLMFDGPSSVQRFGMQLKPTTPTKHGGAYPPKSKSCCFNELSTISGRHRTPKSYDTSASSIPKSKSFSHHLTSSLHRNWHTNHVDDVGHDVNNNRLGYGRDHHHQNHRNHRNHLIDSGAAAKSNANYRKGFDDQYADDYTEDDDDGGDYNGNKFRIIHPPDRILTTDTDCQRPDKRNNLCGRVDYRHRICDREGCMNEDCLKNGRPPQDKNNTNQLMNDYVLKRRFNNFESNLVLNSDQELDGEEEEQELNNRNHDTINHDFYRSADQIRDYDDSKVNSYSYAPTHPYPTANRAPIPAIRVPHNQGRPFNRGRSLDYDDLNFPATKNLHYIDKNLNIVNFLNSSTQCNRRRRQNGKSIAGDSETEPPIEPIFNPNFDTGVSPRKERNNGFRSRINRLRQFSSVDVDDEKAAQRQQQDHHNLIHNTTASIFGNLINSPPSSLPPSLCSSLETGEAAMHDNNNASKNPYPAMTALDVDRGFFDFLKGPLRDQKEPMPKKSCMKKTRNDLIIHHPDQTTLDYKLHEYYPQEEFNDPSLSPPLPQTAQLSSATGTLYPATGPADDLSDDPLAQNFDENTPNTVTDTAALEPNALNMIQNIFSIYKPSEYSPLNCHNPQMVDGKVDSYCKKIALPSTMRPLGERRGCIYQNENNNHLMDMDDMEEDGVDCCLEDEEGELEAAAGTFVDFPKSSLKRPLRVVKSKSCHDALSTTDDDTVSHHQQHHQWRNRSVKNNGKLMTSSNNSLTEKSGLFKFSPTSTTSTSYFYPFDYYFDTAEQKKIKLRSTSRPLSFSN